MTAKNDIDFDQCPVGRELRAEVGGLCKKVKCLSAQDVQPLKEAIMTKVSLRLFLTAILIIATVLMSIGAMNWSVKNSIAEIEKSIAVAREWHISVDSCLERLTENVQCLTIHQQIRLDREKRGVEERSRSHESESSSLTP